MAVFSILWHLLVPVLSLIGGRALLAPPKDVFGLILAFRGG